MRPIAGKQGFLIMGVVNVTPDSFSDGGRNLAVEEARRTASQLMTDGADLVDFGAESTRPGASDVSLDIELARLIPVLEMVRNDVPAGRISVDSRKDAVFDEAASLGVRWFNRVGEAPAQDLMGRLAGFGDARLAVTHIHGSPATMQGSPLGAADSIAAVDRFFASVEAIAAKAGFSAGNLWLDPGIGFGKSLAGNLALIGEIRRWSENRQVMIGVSRKSFLGRLFGIESPVERDPPGKAVELMCAIAGAMVIRTHDVIGLARIRERMSRE